MAQESSESIGSKVLSEAEADNKAKAVAPPVSPETVTLKIDGKEVTVPKGTNLIEAAKTVGIDIPHYCYHPDLSIAGNCRMCQIKIEGAPKLEIACNCAAKSGMTVSTQLSSPEVAEAQAATLEFLLINHPLDCTICDQSGHCKLQDYHFAYNAKPSRFLEEKEHKPKAVPLGPTVTLDAERCIMCTRCIRFCDEITKTSELGMLNRGDRSVIAINPGYELNNPFSGSVVDLCPVGALTHSQWRFNTRIWFTKQIDTICPGCSTGCNVRTAARDGEIVHVKARYSKEVNKEWLCDEGRYGFHRFNPKDRILRPRKHNKEVLWSEALNVLSELQACDNIVVLAASDLLVEEYFLLDELISKNFKHVVRAISYRERELTPLEAQLINPDWASNFRGAEFSGFVQGNLSTDYEIALAKIRHGQASGVLLVGDRSILPEDIDDQLVRGLGAAKVSIGLIASLSSKLVSALKIIIPARTILEKTGLLINRKGRLQYNQRSLEPPKGSEPEWRILMRMGNLLGHKFTEPESERQLTLQFLERDERLRKHTIHNIKAGGVQLGAEL